MSVIAIVPARQGSKGIPDKNVAQVGNATLLELAVRVGRAAAGIDEVYVSTDSRAYEAAACRAGARSLGLRPAALAGDDARSVDVVLDLVARLSAPPDVVVLLQPTAPVRTPADLDTALALLRDAAADAVVGVERHDEPHPDKLKRIDERGWLRPFLDGTSSEVPRQRLSAVYRLNGALYVVNGRALHEHRTLLPPATLPLVMARGVNVDHEWDLVLLRALVDAGELTLFGSDV